MNPTTRPAADSSSVPYISVDEADTHLDFLPSGAHQSWPQPDPLDKAAVMFTSGTTGRPKGVEITQANYSFTGEVMAHEAGLLADDRQLVVLPLFHANAQFYSFASAISTGSSIALMHTFSASRFLDQAVRHEGHVCQPVRSPDPDDSVQRNTRSRGWPYGIAGLPRTSHRPIFPKSPIGSGARLVSSTA